MARRRSFGAIRKLPSKRYQASYIGPDTQRHLAPVTFSTVMDAEAWLVDERRLVESGSWLSPATRRAAATRGAESEELTVKKFARDMWMPDLTLRPTTRRDYESLLKNHIAPTLGSVPIDQLTKANVRTWWSGLDPTKPRARSKAFQLLHNIMSGAVDLELIAVNPVVLPSRTKIRTKRAKKVESLTVEQLEAIADAMPKRLRMAVLIGGFCGLRYGELSELRRRDIDLKAGTIMVSRGVVKVRGGYVVGETKTESGVRPIHVPPHLLADLKKHLANYAGWGQDGLVFPAPNGGHLHSSTFARAFAKAATAAGRPDATPHTLRHTSVSLAHEAGATFATNRARHGHASDAMTELYTHSLDGADARLAGRLSKLVTK